jgi:excinuclease ABC subunit C
MVVFEDGLPRKNEYRRFVIRGQRRSHDADEVTQNDVAGIEEVVARRFRRYLEERESSGDIELSGNGDGSSDRDSDAQQVTSGGRGAIDPETGRPRRFAYPPNLVVVDGGAPQVAAAQRALNALGIDDVALCGLAKRLEEVWLPTEDEPVILPRTSEGLYLLQRVRDEAHRFAITFHRQKRSRSMTASALDGIPGLGETRRRALLRHFGSLRRLRAASPEEIAEVPGIGLRTAQTIATSLASGAETGQTAGAVNMATGEILDYDAVAATAAVDPATGEIASDSDAFEAADASAELVDDDIDGPADDSADMESAVGGHVVPGVADIPDEMSVAVMSSAEETRG